MTCPSLSLQYFDGFLSKGKGRYTVTQWAEVQRGETAQPGLRISGVLMMGTAFQVFIRCQEFCWTLDVQNFMDSSQQT